MGWLQDLLKEVPLSSVLRERVVLAEEKFDSASKEVRDCKKRIADLEQEIEALRAQIPSEPAGELATDTTRVLVYVFRAAELDDRDVGAIATALEMERGVLQYHLDRLSDAGLAEVTGGNYVHGHVYWGLTAEGRRYVVEMRLI